MSIIEFCYIPLPPPKKLKLLNYEFFFLEKKVKTSMPQIDYSSVAGVEVKCGDEASNYHMVSGAEAPFFNFYILICFFI